MIAYTTTPTVTTSLKALLGGAVTTNNLQSTVFFHDVLRNQRPDNAAYMTVPQYASLAGTSETEICAAPASGVTRYIDSIHIYNADTVAATVTIFLDDGTNRILVKQTLQVAETIVFIPTGIGWQIL